MTSTMFTIAAVLAVATVVAGFLLARPMASWSARRSARQPLPYTLEGEKDTLCGLYAFPELLNDLDPLTAEMFVDADHRALFTLLAENPPLDDELTREWQQRIQEDHPGLLPTWITTSELTSVDAVVEVASEVVYSADARNVYTGSGLVEDTGDPANPVRRAVPEVSTGVLWRARTWLIGLGLAGVGLAWWLNQDSPSGLLAAFAALLLLVYVGYHLARVDAITLYVDVPVLSWGTLAGFLLLGLAAALGNGSLTVGLLAGLGAGVGLAAVGFIFKMIRGRVGMAGGDIMMLPLAVGLPAGLAASAAWGLTALFGGCLLSMIGFIVVRVSAKRRGIDPAGLPFAFGPYLMMGWVLAAPLAALLSL